MRNNPIIRTSIIIILTCLTLIYCRKREGLLPNNNGPGNKSPIAKAGPDQTILLPLDSVFLDGSNSADPDGFISTWLWAKISGPDTFHIINTAIPGTTIKDLKAGMYRFELKITDDKGLTAKDTVQITVNDPWQSNRPPVAEAGPDQVLALPLNSNASAIIDAGNSYDPDNNISNYKWTGISGPVPSAINNQAGIQTLISFTQPGVYKVELEVTDIGGLSDKDTVQITVYNPINNRPPVADAGADRYIVIPASSVMLDGSNSSDPEDNLVDFNWRNITGPGSYLIVTPNGILTEVKSLIAGQYSFELKVTDAGGLSDADTVNVTVAVNINCPTRPFINASLVPIGTLSIPRATLKAGAANGKILFAAGWTPGAHSSRVDIFDIASNSWSTAELTEARRDGMAVVSLGDKIFFAGGGDDDWIDLTSRVDIYNASTNSWSTAELSQARNYLAAVTAGNKVYFAGGGIWQNYHIGSPVVDVYDNELNTWSVMSLSDGRYELSAAAAGNKIYFAGGIKNMFTGSTRIDIFDSQTNQWTTTELAQVKTGHASVVSGNKILFGAGALNSYQSGYSLSDMVEYKDLLTGVSTFGCMTPKAKFRTVTKGENIIFFTGGFNSPGNTFDIYNETTNSWSIGVLPVSIYGAAIISVNNTIYVAGGWVYGSYSDQVWKLEF